SRVSSRSRSGRSRASSGGDSRRSRSARSRSFSSCSRSRRRSCSPPRSRPSRGARRCARSPRFSRDVVHAPRERRRAPRRKEKTMREISMKLGFRWWVMVAIAFAGALFPPATSLARRMGGGAPRPIRLEVYWDRHRTDPGILEDVTISATGHAKHDFGIAALQAYKPEEEGPQVLRHSTLRPVTLLLSG